jgi:hypothetical protein
MLFMSLQRGCADAPDATPTRPFSHLMEGVLRSSNDRVTKTYSAARLQ